MLFQKTFTIEFGRNLNNTNYYFEYKEGNEFGYFVEMKYGNIQYEIRLEAIDFLMKIKKFDNLKGVVQGWDGDKFCNIPNYMTPEDLLMEEGDELDWNYKGAPCHY